MPRHCFQESNTSLKDIQNLGTNDIITSYRPGPDPLSSFANYSESSTSDQQVISYEGVTKSKVFTGSEMVNFPDAELEWKVDNLDWARSDIDMLCVKTGKRRG